MQQRQANKKHKKSQVKIEFTSKFITSWGGTTFFIKEVLHTNDNKGKKLCTLRMEFLVVPAIMGKDGRDDVLRLGISNQKRRALFSDVLDRLKDLRLTFYCNAVENMGGVMN